jgi:hypothetical protein
MERALRWYGAHQLYMLLTSNLSTGKMHSQINTAEAAKLDSTTLNVPNKTDGFLIQLDIYHQLHCLNTIRKALWLPGVERYSSDFHNFVTADGGRNYKGKNAQHIGKSSPL